MKKVFSMLWRVSISLVLLVILFQKIDYKATFKVIAHIDLAYFSLAVIIFFILEILVIYRWKMLLDAQEVGLPLSRVVSSFCGGIFLNLFLPSTIGGDIARSVDLGTHTKRYSVIAASVLLDRLSGFAGVVLVALVSLIFGYRLFLDEPSVYLMVFIFTGLLGGLLLFIFHKGIYNWLNRTSIPKNKNASEPAVITGLRDKIIKLHSEMHFFRSRPQVLYLNLLCSVLIQFGCALVSYFLLLSLHAGTRIIYPLVFTPITIIITTLPISVGGLGLRDVSSIFFYGKAGVAKDAALAQSLLTFAIMAAFSLLAGIIYVSTLHNRRLQPDQTGAGSQ